MGGKEEGVELFLKNDKKEKERPKTKEQGTQKYLDSPRGKSVFVTSLGLINDDEEEEGVDRTQSTEL